MQTSLLKRTFDIMVAGVAMIVLAPLLLIVAACILLIDGRPIFFIQMRPGFGGKPFQLFKFRTMRASTTGDSTADAARMTWLGRLLRSTSLDELPELWNVLNGDMSLVGPRPLLMEYLPIYTADQSRRHEVRPGITGWAQINGRNALSWEERFALDVWYVDNQSFLFDLRILWLTTWKVFRREGISEEGEATMSKFTGSAQ